MYSYSYKYYIYTVHTPINIIYTVYSYKYYIYTNIIINIIYVYTPINIIYTVYSYKYYTYYLLSDFSHCPGLRRADISALYPKNIYLYRILSNLHIVINFQDVYCIESQKFFTKFITYYNYTLNKKELIIA